MKTGKKIILTIVLLLFVAGMFYWYAGNQKIITKVQETTKKPIVNSSLIGTILPPRYTTGSIDTRVTQDNIQQTICVSGYTRTVRPPVSVTEKIKNQKMKEMGFTDSMKNYELDHLISLELGGCPDCIDNLWIESYLTTPNAKDKDKLENYLHKQVCDGKMALKEAQTEIAKDWYSAYEKYGLT